MATVLLEALRQLAQVVDAGKVRAQVGAVYPLAETRNAFTAKAGQREKGRR